MKDEYAYVLDFLEYGHHFGRKEPIAQMLGERYFNLLEVVVRDNVRLSVGSRVYIGEKTRAEVRFIKDRISFDSLTGNAKAELPFIVEKIVQENEQRFLEFFNKAGPINARLHTLELLPGIGKKHMWEIIEEREKKPFESFKDLKSRLKLLPNPEKILVKRILQEIEGKEKRYLFVNPPPKQESRKV
jgi:putative nucleotide binding protein